MRTLPPKKVGKIVLIQCLLTLSISVALILISKTAALSALIGGFAAAAGNAFFAFWVFRRYSAQEPGKMLGSFYAAELGKLVLTGLIFLAAILWVKPLNIAALLSVFIVVHLASSVIAAQSGEQNKTKS